jgi:hypothetical protein
LGRGVNTYSTKVHWWDVLFETRKTIGQKLARLNIEFGSAKEPIRKGILE